MTPVEGMQGRMLGRRPHDPSLPRLRLARFLRVALPGIPAEQDYTDIADWRMYLNDSLGDCGPADVAHSARQVTHYLGTEFVPTDDDVVKLYSEVSGYDPRTGANDNGVVMQEMFNVLRKQGIAGRKPVAFAQVNHTDANEMRAAISIFGGLHLGVTLHTAQQQGQVWDYVRNSPIWGGHAVYLAGYKPGRWRIISWGEEYEYTDAFGVQQLDEAWVVIWPEHLSNHQFRQDIDMGQMAADYKEITGQDLPFPTPPDPPPGPPTPPPPAPPPNSGLDQVSLAVAESLANAVGEPAKHVRDHRGHSGALREKIYQAGQFRVGIIDEDA